MKFVDKFENNKVTKNFKGLFYAVLKTEGELLIEIDQWDMAIKCFKTLKDFLKAWGNKDHLIMRTLEQIGFCYRANTMYRISTTYFKKALMMAYILNDRLAELNIYE